jgi:predicted RNA binding protein YcfA (HicA-like mRNA interferase family)
VSRLKLLPYRDLAKVAEAAGFEWVRCRGSHNTFRSPDGRVIVIPDHGNQVIVRSLLRQIVRDMGLTVDEYNRLVDSS